jgi:glycine cleavage system regulatory protein
MPDSRDHLVELTCGGLASAAWQAAVTQTAALRLLIQEISGSATLPPVVLHLAGGCQEMRVAVKSVSRGGDDSNKQEALVCNATSIRGAEAAFRAKFERHSTITFATESDRPGLAAEVTELLRLHGANITHAQVNSDRASRSAVHEYKVEDAVVGGRLSNAVLARLEAGLGALRGAGAEVRRVIRTQQRSSAASGDAEPSPGSLGDGGAAVAELSASGGGRRVYLVRVMCSSGHRNAWQGAVGVGGLRESIKELTGTPAIPDVELQMLPLGAQARIEVASTLADGGTHKWQVVCSGDTVEAVQALVCVALGNSSTVTFKTDNDRPGLLAEVTELLKLHGADIKRAEVSVESKSKQALHVYEVTDATTGHRLSHATLTRLEADFKILRDAAPQVRSILAAAGC